MSEPEIISPIKERKQSECSDTECDLQFKPIVVLPEVEVSTNEENENELLKIRAKLYRFDSSTDPPEWKERGTGDMKILQHKENNSVRVVMRRDKTLKVCANHFITPWMDLKTSSSTDKAFIYTVLADFADEQLKSECLAVKFATVDNANLFKSKFEEAKNIVSTQCHLFNGKDDEDDEDDETEKENVKDSDGDDDEEDESEKKDESAEKECINVIQKLNKLDVSKEDK